jgi:hypothetical protein
VPKLLDEHGVVSLEVVVGIHYFVGEVPLLLVFLEFTHLNEEVSDVADEIAEADEGRVASVSSQLGQKRVLAVRVAVVEVSDAEEKGLVEEFGFAEEIFLEDTEEQLGPSALLDHVLPPHEFRHLLAFRANLEPIGLVCVVVSIPLVDFKLVVLFFLDGLRDVAPGQLDDKYLFAVLDDVGMFNDEGEAIGDDFLFGKERSLVGFFYPCPVFSVYLT